MKGFADLDIYRNVVSAFAANHRCAATRLGKDNNRRTNFHLSILRNLDDLPLAARAPHRFTCVNLSIIRAA